MRYILILFSVLIGTSQANELDHPNSVIGKWEVTETHYCPHICAMDEKEASSYTGVVFEFSEFNARVLGEECKDVSYLYGNLTLDDFYRGHRFYPDEIELNDQLIIEVSLHCGGSLESGGINLGSVLYIKNQDEILTWLDGVYFLARRLK